MASLSTAPRIDERLSGRDNNLNLVRMVAAIAVLVSHAFPISGGQGAAEPFEGLVGMTLGTIAVCVFFGISGLLITRSFDRRKTLVRFVMARILRLFPGLFAALVLTVAFGAAITTLPLRDYLTTSATWTYIPRNMSLSQMQFDLPGVFETNPSPKMVNGSLWTLFYEMICYAAVFVCGCIGLLRYRTIFTALFLLLSLAYGASLIQVPGGRLGYILDRLIRLAWPFPLGMMAYLWRDRLVLDGRIALALCLLCLPAFFAGVLLPVFLIALLYAVAWFAFVPKGWLLGYNRVGDYSYGVYIFAYPTQQFATGVLGASDPLTNIVYSLPITLILAVISWRFIEERALRKVPLYANWIEQRLGGSRPSAS